MKSLKKFFDQFSLAFYTSHLIRWTLRIIPLSVLIGSMVALFLWLLDKATNFRYDHGWLLFLLPIAGIAIHFLYRYYGKNAEAGNNLIIDEIHEPGAGVPLSMAPLVLFTTIFTHLFGGSAGREGTAVQIGGSLAQFGAKVFRLSGESVSMLLMTGVAAGFGAVFGTPVAGAIFALEVLAVGRIRHEVLLPSFIASLVADLTCRGWGIHHTQYQVLFHDSGKVFFSVIHFDLLLLFKVIVAGVLFGLTGRAFAAITHATKTYAGKLIRPAWLIPAAGGIVIIALTLLLGTRDYLGLGVTNPGPEGVSIVSSFQPGGARTFSWLWKLLLTAITLGTGFKGGEVTPLFFIGATLGNTLATISNAPVDLMAAIGFIAVFAGATNTPIACVFMGVELFGANNLLYYAVACFTAYYFSGNSGIYQTQRITGSKISASPSQEEKTLRQVREERIRKRRLWLRKRVFKK